MTGLRVFLLCMTAFALLCVAGFVLLDRADGEEVPPRPRPRIQAAAAIQTPKPVTTPITPARVEAPALPTGVRVREPTEPLPEITTTVTDSESEPGDEAEAPEGTITEPPEAWLTDTKQELTRLFVDCQRIEGEAVEDPVSIEVELVYEPDVLDGPAERAATASVDDPYLAACLSDSLWDAEIPDLGGPGAFQHRMTFQLTP